MHFSEFGVCGTINYVRVGLYVLQMKKVNDAFRIKKNAFGKYVLHVGVRLSILICIQKMDSLQGKMVLK